MHKTLTELSFYKIYPSEECRWLWTTFLLRGSSFKVCIFQGYGIALSKDHFASPIKRSTVSLNLFETQLYLAV